jgi:hypothetical protein
MKRLIAISTAMVSFASFPASAHHSLSPYVMSTYRTIDGTVKSFEWANPHARLALLVPGANSSSTLWDFEGGSIGRLMGGGLHQRHDPRRRQAHGLVQSASQQFDWRVLSRGHHRRGHHLRD